MVGYRDVVSSVEMLRPPAGWDLPCDSSSRHVVTRIRRLDGLNN